MTVSIWSPIVEAVAADKGWQLLWVEDDCVRFSDRQEDDADFVEVKFVPSTSLFYVKEAMPNETPPQPRPTLAAADPACYDKVANCLRNLQPNFTATLFLAVQSGG